MKSNKALVSQLVRSGKLKTKAIIGAFSKIDRADFVPGEFKNDAYWDEPVPIGQDLFTSQPSTIAFMLEKIQPVRGDKILEIGTGSGYLTALLAVLVGKRGRLFSIEYFPELRDFAQANLEGYGFKNVELTAGDGKVGLPQEAPFDKIISSAEANRVPEAWWEQLKIGGSLLTPFDSKILLARKMAEDEFEEKLFPVFSFVPLL